MKTLPKHWVYNINSLNGASISNRNHDPNRHTAKESFPDKGEDFFRLLGDLRLLSNPFARFGACPCQVHGFLWELLQSSSAYALPSHDPIPPHDPLGFRIPAIPHPPYREKKTFQATKPFRYANLRYLMYDKEKVLSNYMPVSRFTLAPALY